MRKFSFVLFILTVLLAIMMVPAALAQDDDVSNGCSTLDSLTGINNSSITDSFSQGEEIEFEVIGVVPPGSTWTVTINGDEVLTASTGTGFSYTFGSTGTFTIATTTDPDNFEIGVFCEDSGGKLPGWLDPSDKTLCHRPPGNPAAAHTITVGSANAFNTHLGHGDSPGMCPPGINSRADYDAGGLVFYIIIDNPDDNIDVEFEGFNLWGLCVEGHCESLLSITIQQIFILSGSLPEGGYEEYEGEDGYTVRVYFLGNQDRDGNGEYEDVMQINIYLNGVLHNDDVLILFAADGTPSWTMNEVIGVDISILFSDGSEDDTDDVCDADGADDIADTEDDEVCEPSS